MYQPKNVWGIFRKENARTRVAMDDHACKNAHTYIYICTYTIHTYYNIYFICTYAQHIKIHSSISFCSGPSALLWQGEELHLGAFLLPRWMDSPFGIPVALLGCLVPNIKHREHDSRCHNEQWSELSKKNNYCSPPACHLNGLDTRAALDKLESRLPWKRINTCTAIICLVRK